MLEDDVKQIKYYNAFTFLYTLLSFLAQIFILYNLYYIILYYDLLFFLLFLLSSGGWILDNFPQTREQWSLMVEKNLIPDDVIFLRDNSDGGELQCSWRRQLTVPYVCEVTWLRSVLQATYYWRDGTRWTSNRSMNRLSNGLKKRRRLRDNRRRNSGNWQTSIQSRIIHEIGEPNDFINCWLAFRMK